MKHRMTFYIQKVPPLMLAVEMDHQLAIKALLELKDEDSFLVNANAIVPVSVFYEFSIHISRWTSSRA